MSCDMMMLKTVWIETGWCWNGMNCDTMMLNYGYELWGYESKYELWRYERMSFARYEFWCAPMLDSNFSNPGSSNSRRCFQQYAKALDLTLICPFLKGFFQYEVYSGMNDEFVLMWQFFFLVESCIIGRSEFLLMIHSNF